MGQGPLRDPRLLEIEAKLNAGRFEDAQRLLSNAPAAHGGDAASAYFSTRILFQRGRLDQRGVIERLKELLSRVDDFPEAERMLRAAEAGTLEAEPDAFRRATGAPRTPRPEVAEMELSPAAPAEVVITRNDQLDTALTDPSRPPQKQRAPAPFGRASLPNQPIPRAPLVPKFTPRAGTPSYVPPKTSLETLELVAPVLEPSEPKAEPKPKPEPKPEPKRFPEIPSLQVPQAATAEAREKPEPAALKDLSTLPPPSADAHEAVVRLDPPRPPTLFEITAALDAGHPQRALELAQRAEQHESGPELVVLLARALAALGLRGQAQERLERLLRAPLLEPLVRASSARTLLELGSPEIALAQARRAVAEDPDDPVARVTCAWALVRMLRRTGDRSFAEEAEPLLSASRQREGAAAALLTAIRAYVQAEVGDASQALALAQATLQSDPQQTDAWSAVALASARLGQGPETERAQQRVLSLDPESAKDLAHALRRHGGVARAVRRDSVAVSELVALWGDVEAALVRGQREPALRALETTCAERGRPLLRRAEPEAWSELAHLSARLFTELPVLRHFAPYDCSIFSIDRLDAALSMIYAAPIPERADDPLVACVGAYLGETYRQAYGGEWRGAPSALLSASIQGVGLSARPCQAALARLRNATPLNLDAPQRLHPGADPLGNTVPLRQRPPAPWDPARFPELAQLRRTGRRLPQSVLGLYCEHALKAPLDHSLSGSIAIDRLVTLLAPTKAPPDPDAPWAERASLLLGAYIGELLVDNVNARWEETSVPTNVDGYHLVLSNGTRASPIARVLERLSGRRGGLLSDYVARLAGGRVSVPA